MIMLENLTVEIVSDGNIEQCRDLCNELMVFQKSKASIHPELFDFMTFETRMKPGYEAALEKQVIVVKDSGLPVGYVFSTINMVKEKDRTALPDWAPKADNQTGFYPDWVKLPQKIGCLSNLYLRDEYKNMGLGSKLTNMAMDWLRGFSDCGLTFVYISNGNGYAYKFYLNKGFVYSHEVFGGFIKAAYYKRA